MAAFLGSMIFCSFQPVSNGFQNRYRPQNPPLAIAQRFESGHRHQGKERGFCLSLFLYVGGGLELIQMQQSGGLLLAAGWTAATQSFSPNGRNCKSSPVTGIMIRIAITFTPAFPSLPKMIAEYYPRHKKRHSLCCACNF